LSTADNNNHSVNLSITNHSFNLSTMFSPPGTALRTRKTDYFIVDDINGNGRASFQISPPRATGIFDRSDEFNSEHVICEDDEEIEEGEDNGEIASFTFQEFLEHFNIPTFHDNLSLSNRRLTMHHREEIKQPETKEEKLQLVYITASEFAALEKMNNDLTPQIDILQQKVARYQAEFEDNNPPICVLSQKLEENSSKERKIRHQLSILRNMCKLKAVMRPLDFKIEMKRDCIEKISNHSNKIMNGDIKKLTKYKEHLKGLIDELEVTFQQEREALALQEASKVKPSQPISQDSSAAFTSQAPVEHRLPMSNLAQEKKDAMNVYSILRNIGSNWEPVILNASKLQFRYNYQQLGVKIDMSVEMNGEQITMIELNPSSIGSLTGDNMYIKIRDTLVQDCLDTIVSKKHQIMFQGCHIHQLPSIMQDISLRLSRTLCICEELQQIVYNCGTEMYIMLEKKQDNIPGVPISFVFSSRKMMRRFAVTMLLSSDYPYDKSIMQFFCDVGPITEPQLRELITNIPFHRFGRLIQIAKTLCTLLH
jgi:hypothetical protein